jgi:hypothetical protein
VLLNRSQLAMVIGMVVGLALTSTLVLRTTSAVFSGTTTTPSNSWSTGGAQITNDHSATAVFDTSTDGLLTGNQVIQRCVVVTYQGSTTAGASVKLYSTASGALAGKLNLVVDQGSGTTAGTSGSCTGFTVGTAGIYSGTVSGLASSATDFSTGVGSWAPGAVGSTMTYRFTVTVQNVTAAQNVSAAGTFTWEAQV